MKKNDIISKLFDLKNKNIVITFTNNDSLYKTIMIDQKRQGLAWMTLH